MKWWPFLLLVALLACEDRETPKGTISLPEIPANFPIPDSIRFLSEQSIHQIELGRALFYDPGLSRDSSVSCASCHKQALAFGDGLAFSVGAHGGSGRRNAPPLFNLFYPQLFFKDGGIPRLEEVAMAPMDDHHELDLPLQDLSLRLRTSTFYVDEIKRIYNREPDPYSITRALMWFQLSLVSANSRYDDYQYREQQGTLTAQEQSGLDLFFSERTQCASCHSGPNFTDFQFHNVGLNMEAHLDTGRARITNNPADFARFKTPSLRNLGFSAPYMHDGRYSNLEQVLAYYNGGGDGYPGQDPRIKPLGLTEKELEDLEAFLYSLNDSVFVSHAAYQPLGGSQD
jgi:cytochrome c peroxidase